MALDRKRARPTAHPFGRFRLKPMEKAKANVTPAASGIGLGRAAFRLGGMPDAAVPRDLACLGFYKKKG